MLTRPGIIHIGFPKCASTLMQKYIIPKCEVFDPTPFAWSHLLYRLVHSDIPLTECVETFEKKVTIDLRSAENSLPIFFSLESIIGEFPLNRLNSNRFLEVIKTIFPNCKIMIILRRQDTMTQSLYVDSIKNSYSESVTQFLSLGEDSSFMPYNYSYIYGTNGPYISVKSLDYLKILGEVENYFDRKTVNIFLFERFCENPQLVLNNMLDIIGVKHVNIDFSRTENVSLSNFSYIILKVVNRILWVDHNSVKIIPSYPFADKIHRDKNALHRLLAFLSSLVTPRYILVDCIDKFFKLPKARPFSNKLMLQILNEHKESNAELDEKYSLGLKEYGYY